MRPPNCPRKTPLNAPHLSITRPIRPTPIRTTVPLSDLPSVTSLAFYTSSCLSMRNLRWYVTPDPPAVHLTYVNRPIWLHPDASYRPWCRYTQYLHSLFLMCHPTTNWRPVTRAMIVQFCTRSLKFLAELS